MAYNAGNPFKWRQHKGRLILLCVRWYLALALVSYCDTFREIIAWPLYRRLVQVFVDTISNGIQQAFVTTAADFADTNVKCNGGFRQCKIPLSRNLVFRVRSFRA